MLPLPTDPDLRRRCIDSDITVTVASISRSRRIWAIGSVFALALATAIFNANCSWNHNQILRRARLLYAVSSADNLRNAISRAKDNNHDWDFLLAALQSGVGELGYLKYLSFPDGTKQTTDKGLLTALRDQAERDLELHVQRGVSFDTVGLPFLGMTVTGTDIGIVGGLAFILIGYWLLASVRREMISLSTFARKRPGEEYEIFHGGYTHAESTYAYRTISQSMVFSDETGGLINAMTVVIVLLAPLLLTINHIMTAHDVLSKGLGGYWQPHVVAEAAVGAAAWAICAGIIGYYHSGTMLMQAWKTLLAAPNVLAPQAPMANPPRQ